MRVLILELSTSIRKYLFENREFRTSELSERKHFGPSSRIQVSILFLEWRFIEHRTFLNLGVGRTAIEAHDGRHKRVEEIEKGTKIDNNASTKRLGDTFGR